MLSSAGLASTTSWEDGGVVKIKFGPGTDARVLFDALLLKPSLLTNKSLKTFKTLDGRFHLQCKRELDRDISVHTCVSAINTNEVSNSETTVYKDRNYWRLNLDNETEAEDLFKALKIPEREGRSGFAKTFRTGEGKFELFCTRSKIPFGPKYGCSMAIDLK